MRPSRSVLVITILLMLTTIGHAQGDRTSVHVRVYDTTGVAAQERRPSLDAAARLVADASVDVIWLVCGGRPPDEAPRADANAVACLSPLRLGDLALRLVDVTDLGQGEGPLPLGYALVGSTGKPGLLATVYLNRIANLARQALADPQALLARVIAHELGHLLLGTKAHSDAGLMRPLWSRQELTRHHDQDWVFTPSDAAAIRARSSRAN